MTAAAERVSVRKCRSTPGVQTNRCAVMNKKLRTTLQLCALIAAITIPTGLAMAQSAAELVARVAGSDVNVSFDLRPQRTEDLARRLVTSAPVSVIWIVDARQRARFWRDVPVQRAVVRVTARRAASDLFTITRVVDGQQSLAVQATLADTCRYLTSFETLPLCRKADLAASGGYRVEIRAILDGGGEPKIDTAVLAEGALAR
jgi:hypothetical protein